MPTTHHEEAMPTTSATPSLTVSCPACSRLNRIDLERARLGARCGACGKPIPLDRPLHVTDADLERVATRSDVPVLVDFYADWCGPCKTMAPLLDELAREHAGRALVAKLDTERNRVMSSRFQIAGIPTLIVFLRGWVVAKQVGALSKQGLQALLQRGYEAAEG